MIVQIITAVLRGIALAFAVAIPSLFLVQSGSDGSYIVVLGALFIGVLVSLEYLNTYPSLLELRDAPPFNRIRFLHAVSVILSTSLLIGAANGYEISRALVSTATIFGHLMDFDYSPIHLTVLMLPIDLSAPVIEAVRMAAGLGFVTSVITIAMFLAIIRFTRWPLSRGTFNVWTNLPLLDPTSGGDIVMRLTRDGRVNIAIGCVMPFVFPALVKIIGLVLGQAFFYDPQSLAWLIIIWAVMPTTFIMRGIAMLRVGELIAHKRLANEQSHGLQMG